MTPQELKNSILQLAIQGKLVEQRPEEGSARVLLKSLEVSDSVDGQRVKQKEITDISDDEKGFEIPANWEWVKLGSVCVIARGGSPRPIKNFITDNPSGINWIKIGDTEKNGKYISSTAEKIIPEGVSKSRMVHAGDFLLTNSMSFGRPYILKIDGCIHDGWLVISQQKEVFYQDFLFWLLSSAYAYSQFCGKVSGAVVKNLNSDKVANSVFPLPPLAEQKRIVAKIEEMLPYIDRYEQAWSQLEDFNKRFPTDMQKSILQMAIQGKLVEQLPEEGTGEELYQQIHAEKQRLIKAGTIKKGKPLPEITEDEKPFDIPESWKWVRLGACSSYSQRKEKVNAGAITDDMWSLDLGDIEKDTGRIINKCQAIERKIAGDKVQFRKGQILYSKLRPYLKKVLIAPDDGICSSEMVPFVSYGNINAQYLVYALVSPHVDYVVNSVTYGVKMPRVGTETMVNLLIPLPPLTEQQRIVAKLQEILPLCDKLK